MDADMGNKVEQFARQYFSGVYVTKENTAEKGTKLRYAAYMKNRLVGGLSQASYDANKEEIDAIMASAKAERHERDARESWVVRALTDSMIRQVTHGEDYNLFDLNAELPRDVWDKIKQFTSYISNDDDMEGGCDFGGENFRGWTVAPKAEAILKAEAEKIATPEQRDLAKKILAEMEEARKAAEEKKHARQQKRQILDEVAAAFEGAEYPEGGQFRLEGESIDDPFYPPDIYGGGRWFVIQQDYIWLVRNNGHDGDDWSRNNVETGGAGAIGTRIKYNAEVAEKIRKLVK